MDLASLNFGNGANLNVLAHIEAIAREISSAGTIPKLEIFVLDHMALSLEMIDANAICQIVLGAPGGAPAITEALAAMKSLLPQGAKWGAFWVGRTEFPVVVHPFRLEGYVRLGLEDNLYPENGVLAPEDASLLTKARSLIETLGGSLATAAEARTLLGIGGRAQ